MLFIMLIKLCFVKNSPPPPDAERETAFPVFIKRRFVHTETAWTVCVKRRGLQSLRGGGGVPACHRPAAVRGVRRSGRGIPVPPGSLRSPRRANLRCIVGRAFPTLCEAENIIVQSQIDFLVCFSYSGIYNLASRETGFDGRLDFSSTHAIGT